METLHLNLTKKWFDMILSGEKKVEYRALTYFWTNRLFDIPKARKIEIDNFFKLNNFSAALYCVAKFKLKPFKTITFSNGMKSIEHLPRFEIEFKKLEIAEGKEEWGAKEGEMYFSLHLWSIIQKQNC